MATEKRGMKREGRRGGSTVRPGLVLLLHKPEQLTGAQQARLPAGFSGRRRRPRAFPAVPGREKQEGVSAWLICLLFPIGQNYWGREGSMPLPPPPWAQDLSSASDWFPRFWKLS